MAELDGKLAPLAKVETAARRLHGIGIAALAAIDHAISELDTASTYEIMDLASSNKGISMMSSMQNHDASSAVQDAGAAITRLSIAVREDIPTELRVAHDTVDLVLDMALDPAFDFMSIFALQRIGDAERRCRAARERVGIVERRLAEALGRATTAADAVRQRIYAVRAPFGDRARNELPATARAHVADGTPSGDGTQAS